MFDSPSIGGFGEILQLQNLTKDRCLTLPQAETKKLKEENQRHKEPEDPSEKSIETDLMVSYGFLLFVKRRYDIPVACQ